MFYWLAKNWFWLHGFSMLHRTISNAGTWATGKSNVFLIQFSVYLLIRFVLIVFCLFLARCFLPLPVLHPAQPIKRALKAIDRFFLELSGKGKVLWHSGLGPCKRNPILWRERAVSLLGQRDHMIRIAYVSLLGICLVTFIVTPFGGWGLSLAVMVAGMVGVPGLLFLAIMIVLPATTFPRERQGGTMDLLAVSPLSARSIVWDKYLFCLRGLLVPLALLGLFLLALFYVCGREEMHQTLRTIYPLVYLIILAPVVVAMILYASIGVQDVGKSLVAGVALTLGVAYLLKQTVFGSMTSSQLLVMAGVKQLPYGLWHTLLFAAPIAGGMAASRLMVRFSAKTTTSILIPVEALTAFLIIRTLSSGTASTTTSSLISCAAGVIFIILAAFFTRMQPGLRRYVYGSLAVVIVLGCSSQFVGAPLLLFYAVLLFLLYRFAVKMSSMIVGRTLLCLIAFWLVMSWLLSTWAMLLVPYGVVLKAGYDSFGYLGWLMVSVALIMTAACLRCTTMQFDVLIGRNG